MTHRDWYNSHFEKNIAGRYITLSHIETVLKRASENFIVTVEGYSEKRKEIPLVTIGTGKRKILAWSQMHGNESTTTKACCDLLAFLMQETNFQKEIKQFLTENTLYLVPILNPDGAALYTRENANGIDLNRDAANLSQIESQYLQKLFVSVKPDLCLNLHDQRSIYGLENSNPAIVSFLSPAADSKRSVTPARATAMKFIEDAHTILQEFIPDSVGRYDDSFNKNCVGDAFTMQGVPTILIEAGHYGQDYNREKSREYVFYALLSILGFVSPSNPENATGYFSIPENKVNYFDIIFRNAKVKGFESPIDLAIQYQEVLRNGTIIFEPTVAQIQLLNKHYEHREIDCYKTLILINSQEIPYVGMKINSIVNENGNSLL